MSMLEIYNYLKRFDLLKNSPKYWWPSAGTFEVVVGAVLTQNTTWKNVEKSLQNLHGYLTLETFLQLDEKELKERIRPSGFYNQKAPRLLALARAIQNDFDSFERFQKEVDRTWLLQQKGIGKESADAILCYACLRPTMVIDAYTKRVLAQFSITYKEYDEYKNFLEKGVEKEWNLLKEEHENNPTLFYARFHGMFVEYAKNMRRSRPFKIPCQ